MDNEPQPDAVLLIDPRERIVSMNDMARRMYEPKYHEDLHALSLPGPIAAMVREALRGGTPPRPSADLSGAFHSARRDSMRTLLPVAVPVPHFEGRASGAVT